MEGIKKFFTNKIFLVTFITIIIVVMIAIFVMNSLNGNNKKNETETESTMTEETTITKPKETETTTKENETEETTVYFREYYDNIIKGYIIENSDTVTDISLLVTAIDGLEEVEGNIEDSFNSEELNESDYNDLNTTVSDLIALYNERIKEIEDATTTTIPPTTSTESPTKPVVQPTTTPEETTTKEETTTSDNSFVNSGDRTDESQNPYIERKGQPSNIVYNPDGTANLTDSTFGFESDVEDQDAWAWDFWTFMEAIPEIREVLNQNSNYTVSYIMIDKYRDTRYTHWDIRDYYLSVREIYYDEELSRNRTRLVKMWHVNDNFKLVEGPIQEDIDAGKVFR